MLHQKGGQAAADLGMPSATHLQKDEVRNSFDLIQVCDV